MLSNFVIGSLLLSLAYAVVTHVNSYRKLSGFRGPLLASVSKIWLIKQSLNHRQHSAIEEALDEYGPYARIGPNLLVTNDPDLTKHMSLPRSSWRRDSWYEVFKFDSKIHNVFSTTDEKNHARLRSKLGPAYSGRSVDNLESTIADQVNSMLDTIRRDHTSSNGTPVDMTRLTQYLTLDVLSTIAFGRTYGYLQANQDLWNYIATAETFFPSMEMLLNFPGLQRRLFENPTIAALLVPKNADNVGQGMNAKIANDAIVERYALAADAAEKGNQQQKADMLGQIVAQGLTLEEAKTEVPIQILAGSDSTSTAFRMTMLYIVTNPRVYRALQTEIDTGVASGKISSTEVIKDSEARQLPYLQAVIWEGLRMCPPLFGLMTKVAPPGGETFKGTFFPNGVRVAASPASITHRKDIFGQDSHIFRPERWLEADETTHAKYLSTVDLIFGSGRFGCLGRSIAMLELNKVFVELLRHFDWAIVDSLRPVKQSVGHMVWVQKGMWMTVTERKR